MKLIIGIIIILSRFYIGFQILKWIVLKSLTPVLHSISEIEIYLVIVIFDIWVCTSQGDIELEITKK